jgi:Spy/CpxP family protein refolding chaperone
MQAGAVPQAQAQQTQSSQPQGQPQVKTIFDYKKELGLTDDQVKKMQDHIAAMNKERKPLGERVAASNKELATLIDKQGDMGEIRKKVKEVYDTLATMRIADIEWNRKIMAVLKPEQVKKWRELQAAARKK